MPYGTRLEEGGVPFPEHLDGLPDLLVEELGNPSRWDQGLPTNRPVCCICNE